MLYVGTVCEWVIVLSINTSMTPGLMGMGNESGRVCFLERWCVAFVRCGVCICVGKGRGVCGVYGVPKGTKPHNYGDP